MDIGISINESGFVILGVSINFGDPLAWLGDWSNNEKVVTLLSFDISNISALDDVTIKDVSVTISVTKIVNKPEDASNEILVFVEAVQVKTLYTSPSLNNLDFSSSKLDEELQKAVDADEQGFQISMGFADVSTNNIKDYYHIHVFSAVLHVTYGVPG